MIPEYQCAGTTYQYRLGILISRCRARASRATVYIYEFLSSNVVDYLYHVMLTGSEGFCSQKHPTALCTSATNVDLDREVFARSM